MSPLRQRLYIWRITHAQDIRNTVLLMALAGIYLLAWEHEMDHCDGWKHRGVFK